MKRRSRIQQLASATPAQLLGTIGMALCAGVFAVLVVVQQVNPQALSHLRGASVDVIRPLAEAIAAPKRAWHDVSHGVSSFFSTYQENKQLKAEQAELLKWQAEASALTLENEQLRSLLQVVPPSKTHYITARMVSDIGAGNRFTALISAGSSEGIKKNQAVITPEGLVGRISDVGTTSSRVLLITDSNSHIPVMGEKGRSKAMVSGKSRGALSLGYVEHSSQFTVGEQLVTSGDGGMLPAGIPVAEINTVNGVNITALPFANARLSTMVTVLDYQF